MKGLWTFARLHGVTGCLTVLIVNATLTAAIATATVETGWFSSNGGLLVPASPLLAALTILAFHPVLASPQPGETTALRHTRSLRWLLLVILLGLATATSVFATWLAGHTDTGFAVARNLIGCLGLALATRPLLGEVAWLTPTAFTMTEMLFGSTLDRQPHAWAWTLHPANSASASAFALTLALVAALVLLPQLGTS